MSLSFISNNTLTNINVILEFSSLICIKKLKKRISREKVELFLKSLFFSCFRNHYCIAVLRIHLLLFKTMFDLIQTIFWHLLKGQSKLFNYLFQIHQENYSECLKGRNSFSLKFWIPSDEVIMPCRAAPCHRNNSLN